MSLRMVVLPGGICVTLNKVISAFAFLAIGSTYLSVLAEFSERSVGKSISFMLRCRLRFKLKFYIIELPVICAYFFTIYKHGIHNNFHIKLVLLNETCK